MILKELVLQNIGVYSGTQQLEFPTTPDAPVILVGGMNGCGKTTILDALQLALYGRRSPGARKYRGSYDSFLRDLVNKNANNDEARVSVGFSLIEDGAEKNFEIDRSWTNSVTRSGVGESLVVKINGQYDLVATERWDDIIESILPQEIAQLFFFDGEKIEQLADPVSSAKVLETAISSLLGVGIVDRLRSDLSTIQRRWTVSELDESARLAVEEMETRIADVHVEISEHVQRRGALQNRFDQSSRELVGAKERFVQGGGELAADIDAIDSDFKLSKNEQALLHQQAVDLAGGSLPLRLVGELRERARRQASLEQTAELQQLTLEQLTERDQLLIDALESSTSDMVLRKEIEQFLVKDRSKRESQARVEKILNVGIRGTTCLDYSSLQLTAHVERSNALSGAILENRRRVADLGRRLESIPPGELVARLAEELSKATARYDELKKELGDIDLVIEDLRHQVATNESQLQRLIEKHAVAIVSSEDKNRMRIHAKRIQKTLEGFRRELLLRHLGSIEDAVLRSFTEILGKVDFVKRLSICPDTYGLTLYGLDDLEIPANRLSAGERQLLATALLWGLARVSGRRLPMVVDTPLGRLDSVHRAALVERYFPVASGQMVVLSTDQEIDGQLLEILDPVISKKYTLRYNAGSRSTSVHPGYFEGGSDAA
jgi:DNA sulfur modification protein DndD